MNKYFGYKGHIEVDVESKIIRKHKFTSANVHDSKLNMQSAGAKTIGRSALRFDIRLKYKHSDDLPVHHSKYYLH